MSESRGKSVEETAATLSEIISILILCLYPKIKNKVFFEFRTPNISQFYEIYGKNEPICSLLAVKI